jgi:hypothetical protein
MYLYMVIFMKSVFVGFRLQLHKINSYFGLTQAVEDPFGC